MIAGAVVSVVGGVVVLFDVSLQVVTEEKLICAELLLAAS